MRSNLARSLARVAWGKCAVYLDICVQITIRDQISLANLSGPEDASSHHVFLRRKRVHVDGVLAGLLREDQPIHLE